MTTIVTLKGSTQGLQKALEIARWYGNISYRYTEDNFGAELSIEGDNAVVDGLIEFTEKAYGLPLAWRYVVDVKWEG